MPSPETRCHSGPGMPFINGGGGSASPHADPGGGRCCLLQGGYSISSRHHHPPRKSLYILECICFEVWTCPVKSLHIMISFDVFSIAKSILMFYALLNRFFLSLYEVAVPVAGLDSLRRFRMGGDLQRLLLLLLVPWVYRETGCRRSEPRISGWSWGGSGYFAVLSQRDAS